MASPKGWRRNKEIERKNKRTEYYWHSPDDMAGTYLNVRKLKRSGKYVVSGQWDGLAISKQNFDDMYSNKEEARKDAVAWMKRNNPLEDPY